MISSVSATSATWGKCVRQKSMNVIQVIFVYYQLNLTSLMNFPDPCINKGECQDLVGDYRCNCKPGYEGRNCEININEESTQSLIFQYDDLDSETRRELCPNFDPLPPSV